MGSGLLISIAVFVAVTVLAAALIFLFNDMGGSATEDRLEVLTGKKVAGPEEQGIMKEDFDRISGGFGQMFARFFKSIEELALFFEQADSPIRPDQCVMISGGLLVLGVILGWASHAPTPLWPIFGLVMASFPCLWLCMRRRSRFKKFAAQLPDAMELIARALRSGHSLNSGIHVVVEEMPAPIATEFMLAYEEQNLGVPIDRALKGMLRRMPNLDLKFFVTAVTIQRQSGGDLAEILDKIGFIIRERFKILGQVLALTGEGRMSGIVLQALPIALFVAVYYMNPEYVMMLFDKPLGRQMLAYGITMQLIGAVVIKKIVNIKV